MGYRQYFYEVDRSIVEGIRKCKTEHFLLYKILLLYRKDKLLSIAVQNKIYKNN